ncbi:MAG: integrase family protein [Myxococcaceae bacterium]|nr:integrase family protein [Myxococcaceae bacterium]
MALDVADLTFLPRLGMEALVRRSKTDQEGHGRVKLIAHGSDPATGPVRSIQDWRELTGITEGAVFRAVNRHGQLNARRMTAQSVALIVKRAIGETGLSGEQFAGHSLRAGFLTEARGNGAHDSAIMEQTGHKSLAMVHRYHRRTQRWDKPASSDCRAGVRLLVQIGGPLCRIAYAEMAGFHRVA